MLTRVTFSPLLRQQRWEPTSAGDFHTHSIFYEGPQSPTRLLAYAHKQKGWPWMCVPMGNGEDFQYCMATVELCWSWRVPVPADASPGERPSSRVCFSLAKPTASGLFCPNPGPVGVSKRRYPDPEAGTEFDPPETESDSEPGSEPESD